MSDTTSGRPPHDGTGLGGDTVSADEVTDTVVSLSRSQRAAAKRMHAMDDFEAAHAGEPIQGGA